MESLLTHLEAKRHVIWDWNGTLLDDVDLAVEAIGEVLSRNRLSPITRDEYRRLFCFPIPEYYRRLGFHRERFETISLEFVECYRKRVPRARLHRGAENLLGRLWGAPRKQSILSAAHEADLEELLDHFGIRSYFDHVYGLSNHHAVSKLERGRELLRDSGVPPEEAVLIGDTDHDCEVGRALGIDVILLGDGHQAYDRLRHLPARVLPVRY